MLLVSREAFTHLQDKQLTVNVTLKVSTKVLYIDGVEYLPAFITEFISKTSNKAYFCLGSKQA